MTPERPNKVPEPTTRRVRAGATAVREMAAENERHHEGGEWGDALRRSARAGERSSKEQLAAAQNRARVAG